MKRLIPLVVILLTASVLSAQEITFQADSVWANIQHLSEVIGPRPMGSTAEAQALRWGLARFQRYGADAAYIIPYDRFQGHGAAINTKSGVAVGIFRGESDSSIVLGGHIDSASPEIPGANDNGSGASTVVELARVWSGRPRRYTMVFAVFGGEEAGLAGSEAFTEKYADLDKVRLMLCVDMSGEKEKIFILSDDKALQSPPWLMRDAFRMDRSLGIHRLVYPTHFLTLNNLAGGAGSDHIPFLQKHIPAIDFTTGVNNSPIHTPQDRLTFIDRKSLADFGQLLEGLINKYQAEGVPEAGNRRYMLLQVAGLLLFIPPFLLRIIIILALLAGLTAYMRSRKERSPQLKDKEIHLSALKVLGVLLTALVFSRLGYAALSLVKGWKMVWPVHLYLYLWYSLVWAAAGIWLALRLFRRFRSEPHTYALRAFIIFFIYSILFGLASARLALYPAMGLLLFSLALFLPWNWPCRILAVLALTPLFPLIFSEAFPFMAHMISLTGFALDSWWKDILYALVLIIGQLILALPAVYVLAWLLARDDPFRSFLGGFKSRAAGWTLAVLVLAGGIILALLPSYNERWRPQVLVTASYNCNSGEDKLQLLGNDFLRNVRVEGDSLNRSYNGRVLKDILPLDFTADWFDVSGNETWHRGEKDTVTLDWMIVSEKPLRQVRMSLSVDTLGIDTAWSDLGFSLGKKSMELTWRWEPPREIPCRITLVKDPGSLLIRRVRAYYTGLPLPLTVEAPLADIIRTTVVTRTDTLRQPVHNN